MLAEYCWHIVVAHLLWQTSIGMKETDFGSMNNAVKMITSEIPQFAGPIENVTVALGREAVLSCTVTELGPYKVGWMKADDQTILALHNRVITHNPRITVNHDDNLKTWQLRIRQLKESDRGCYMCQINTGEMRKQFGCVDVHVPPDIDDVGTSGDVSVGEEENVTLTCSATGHPQPRIGWRREDGEHILVGTFEQQQKVETFHGSSLILARVNRRQMGAYLCIASNDVPPAVSKRITLHVSFPPRVQVQKSLVGIILQSTVKLKCDVEAFPNSNNFWTKGEEMLFKSVKYTLMEKRSGYKIVMLLTIHNATKSDIGTYTCIAQNTMGKSEDSVRLYEIKVPTTTTTSSTTTTTTPSTTITVGTSLILEIASSMKNTTIPSSSEGDTPIRALDKDLPENYLFPSAAPAPLELETHSGSSPMIISSHFVLLLMFISILR